VPKAPLGSDTEKAMHSPSIVLNSFGFSGAETLASYLASHPEIGLLPGQNFIQQADALYRPLTIPDDAEQCFDLLATKQFTKSGIQWAGLGKFMSDEYKSRYSLDAHRSLFTKSHQLLAKADRSNFITVAKLYANCFFDCMQEDTPAFSYLGFYGANVLINSDHYENFTENTRVIQVSPSPSEWLSMASQARTWNPDDAFVFYIVQNLFIALQAKDNNNLLCLEFSKLLNDSDAALNECCDFLNIAQRDSHPVTNGLGHVPISDVFLDKIKSDASAIDAIYKFSRYYDLADTTSHIAFDWNGPIESEIIRVAEQYAAPVLQKRGRHVPTIGNEHGLDADGSAEQPLTVFEQGSIAYQFYQKWYELNSINHTEVLGKPSFPLGDLENELPLPRIQYFMRIAIHYVQSCANLQAEKAHSYKSLRNSALYAQLQSADVQACLDRNWLRDAFNDMEKSIDDAEAVFAQIRTHSASNAIGDAEHLATVTPIGKSQAAKAVYPKLDAHSIKAIAVSGPDISDHENKRVMQAMSDWYDQPYYFCEKFEAEFAQYHNRQFALMTPNCTSANHLLQMGLDIGPGDEVLVPESTWIASATPVYYTGATPVYCDINEDDWCISIDSMRQNLTAKTRAIVVVNVYGNMARMDELEQFADEHDLYLIEDAAESIGSVYKGRKSGEFGIGSVFSFHRTKTLTTGEGGMLLIDNEALYERCVKLRDHGRGPNTPPFTHEMVTNKYMPFNVQAALGLAQFERLDELVGKKRHILSFYKKRLAHFEDVQLNPEPEHVINSGWCSTMVLGESYGMDKKQFAESLLELNVPSRPFFYPLTTQPGIRKKIEKAENYEHRNPVAYSLADRGINLPSALNLTDAQLNYVCDAVERVLNEQIKALHNNGRSKAA